VLRRPSAGRTRGLLRAGRGRQGVRRRRLRLPRFKAGPGRTRTIGVLLMTPTRELRTCQGLASGEIVLQACGSLALQGWELADFLAGAPEAKRLTWDLSLVSDIDAGGLGALAEAARRAASRDATVTMRAASARVHRLAALVGLDAAIPGAWADRSVRDAACSSRCPGARNVC
jgi:ABC-type transporter Mla MlaB component